MVILIAGLRRSDYMLCCWPRPASVRTVGRYSSCCGCRFLCILPVLSCGIWQKYYVDFCAPEKK